MKSRVFLILAFSICTLFSLSIFGDDKDKKPNKPETRAAGKIQQQVHQQHQKQQHQQQQLKQQQHQHRQAVQAKQNLQKKAQVNRNNVTRTPSMSRAASLSPSAKPPQQKAKNRFALPGPDGRHAHGDQKHQRGQDVKNIRSNPQLQQFLDQHKHDQPHGISQRGKHRADGGRREQFQQAQPSFKNRMQGRKEAAHKFRNDVIHQHPDRHRWFNDRFWKKHDYYPDYWHHGQNLWRYGSWTTINNWLSLYQAAPIYYEGGYPLDYQEYGTWQGLEQPSYYPENVQYAGPPSQMESDWLPLGVFALTNNENEPSQAMMFFQLSLNKEGAIEGSYYNQTTDGVFPIEGIIDRSTQRAVWKIAEGENSPIFETGLYNLTLPETSVDVYFGEDVQQWLMIRI